MSRREKLEITSLEFSAQPLIWIIYNQTSTLIHELEYVKDYMNVRLLRGELLVVRKLQLKQPTIISNKMKINEYEPKYHNKNQLPSKFESGVFLNGTVTSSQKI